ncbi:MAG: hypothetical protein ACJAUV_000421 [Flavobacteriales bacterium]|jgi:hypothetical protein
MLRKLLIGGLSIIALVLIVFGYQHFKSLNQIQTDVWSSANPDAIVIISSPDFAHIWERLNETSLIWQELNMLDEVKTFNDFLRNTDSLILKSPTLKAFVNQSDFLVSVIPSGSSTGSIQLSFPVPKSMNFSEFLVLFNPHTSLIEKNIYDEINIHQFLLNGKTLFGAINKGCAYISMSSLLIEESVRNANRNTSIKASKTFQQISATAGKYAKANIFVNYKQLGWLLENNMNKNYTPWSELVGKLGYWGVLDLDLKANSIILNGFSNCADSGLHFLSLFNNQEPQTLDFKKVVPSNTALMLNIGVSSFSDYLNEYRDWLDNQGMLFKYRKNLEKLNLKYGAQTSALAITWIGNQIGAFYTEMNSKANIDKHKLLIFEASNILNAERDLNEISELAGVKQHSSVYRGKTIKSLGVSNLYGLILGSAFDGITTPHYTSIDNYIIIANNASALRDVITKKAVNKTLAQNETFESFNSQLNSDGNIQVYGNFASASDHFQAIFSQKISQWIKSENKHLSNFQSFAFEWTKENQDLYYQHAILNYNPSYKQETGSLWELDLEGAQISTKPLFVKNHYTNNREVLVQDNQFNLNLISNIGKQLWKRQLKEQIIGDPVQIDAFKNGKLQFVFVTKNQLHMIDRNGDDVEGFPITLLSRATTALSVLDYDNNRNYRMLVGCEDGQVYSYMEDGSIVTGWKFDNTTSAIHGVIKHFTIGNKDYIMITEQNGEIHLVDRRGDLRHQVDEKIKNKSLFNEVKLVIGKNIEQSFLYYTTRDGKLIKQQFNNQKIALDLNLSETHLFTMDDINSDGNLEIICTNEKEVLVFSLSGKRLLEKTFSGEIKGFLNTYHFPNGVKRIGFTIPSLNEVHLINILGESHAGFPLYGETDFSIADINKERTFSLVTASSNGKIYTYNLN